jgi:hypothetical protein
MYLSNIRTNTTVYLNKTNYPCVLCCQSSGSGVMSGYPTPPQFFPQQEPIYANENTNLRTLYKRTYWNYSSPTENLNNKTVGDINDSSSRLLRIKSNNVGRNVYKVGLPENALISTKNIDKSLVKRAIRRVRNTI